ncbi:MAG: phenylalanyl-tRNA synthetase alpha chain, partial [Bacteroidota bacterium]|nr:phenylalanyl-tRNA synthetase alpha chain [Bacteroidota bacterium]
MLDKIRELDIEIKARLAQIGSPEELEQFRLQYLVKKGALLALFDALKNVPKEDKPAVGKELNILKKFAEAEYERLNTKFESESTSKPGIDLTLPGRKPFIGRFHPVMQIMDKMVEIFNSLGFAVAEGPDIEDGYHNFDALNFPKDHP